MKQISKRFVVILFILSGFYLTGMVLDKGWIFPLFVFLLGSFFSVYELGSGKRGRATAKIIMIFTILASIFLLATFNYFRQIIIPATVEAKEDVKIVAISSPRQSSSPEQPQDDENDEEECWQDQRVSQWCTSIMEASHKYGLEPKIVAAVILVESGGQPEVISSAGAVGLMQVMPRDGIAAGFQCINGPCFANRPSTDELLDPTFNIDYGSKMLAGLLERHGDIREALKAYGPADYGYIYADLVLNTKEGL